MEVVAFGAHIFKVKAPDIHDEFVRIGHSSQHVSMAFIRRKKVLMTGFWPIQNEYLVPLPVLEDVEVGHWLLFLQI